MLRLEELTRRFGDTVAVDGVSLQVEPGEFVTLLGPSGCGKTTTLRMVAGFEEPSSGRIHVDGRDVTALKPQRRGIGMVFQNYALFPHLDVRENVEFGLRSRGVARAEAGRKVERALELVEMGGYGGRKVQELSGGQQQRVALARALAPEPPLLLLDEPLSNLDAALRERTRTELRALLKRLGMTAVFVTHDQEEAFALSDRIAVLDRGRLQQVASPEALYASPANAFVAAFVGRANFIAGSVEENRADGLLVRLAAGPLWPARPADGLQARPGTAVRVMLRPEALRIAGDAADNAGALRGRVLDRRFAGAATFYRLAAEGGELLVEGRPGAAADGAEVAVEPRGESAVAFPADG
ncbi:MAG TPA: ABC transporter ATP-binding protein [Longimicrobiaceae bacterium]|nr:ABC transporter ATP-binding protein [Longimicrobiaceae bacterium]